MNRTIKLLMISDVIFLTGFGLIGPILSIFIKDNLIGGSIFAAGLASTLFLITKCVVQLPFSRYVDKHDDKVKWLLIGTFMVVVIPFIYIFSTHVNHIYLAQVIYGIGSGLAYPTWLGLWSVNLDKKHESFEWSLYSSLVGLGTAATAAIGAGVAQLFGFVWTFVIVGILAISGSLVLFGLEKKHSGKVKHKHYHKKRKLVHKHH